MSSDYRPQLGLVLGLAVLLAGAGACADFSRGPASSSVDAAGQASTDGGAEGPALSFASEVHAPLVAGCQRCHASGQEAGDTSFLLTGDTAADYSVVTRFVEPSAPAQSRLLAKMAGTNNHGGGTIYGPTTPEYQTILRWIQEGARP
jgi:hypothetical protein